MKWDKTELNTSKGKVISNSQWTDAMQKSQLTWCCKPGLITCGEGELVSGVHTLAGGVVQVYHRLQVQEEEEKGRKVEQEIERRSQVEENARMTMHMEMT